MTRNRRQELSEKADDERRRCRDWLLPFMRDDQPKFLTKDELRLAAIRELNVSKLSFDFAWIDAIERAGRHDWYEPLRRRLRTKSYAPTLSKLATAKRFSAIYIVRHVRRRRSSCPSRCSAAQNAVYGLTILRIARETADFPTIEYTFAGPGLARASAHVSRPSYRYARHCERTA